MSWNKKVKVRKNKIKACFLITFLVFLGLSLFSYHPQDSSFNFVGLSTKVSNYCGFIGASLADGMYQLFGFAGAWLLVIGGLGLALQLLLRSLSENHLSSFLFFLVFLTACIGLAELHFPLLMFFNGEVSLGGVLGQSLSSSMKPLLGTIGTGVILWSVFIAFTVFYGQSLFPLLVNFPKKLLLFLFVKLGSLSKKRKFFTGFFRFFLMILNPLFLLRVGKTGFKKLFSIGFGLRVFKGLSFFKKKYHPVPINNRSTTPYSENFSNETTNREALDRESLGRENLGTKALNSSQSGTLHQMDSQASSMSSSGEKLLNFSFSNSQDNASNSQPGFSTKIETSGNNSSSLNEKSSSSVSKASPFRSSFLKVRAFFFPNSKSSIPSSQTLNHNQNSSDLSAKESPNSEASVLPSYEKRQIYPNLNQDSAQSSNHSNSMELKSTFPNSSDKLSQSSSNPTQEEKASLVFSNSMYKNPSSNLKDKEEITSNKEGTASNKEVNHLLSQPLQSSASSLDTENSSLTRFPKKSFWTRQSIPPIDLLMPAPNSSRKISSKDVEELSKKLLDKLQQFSIRGEIKAIKTGPALVLFEYKPEDHVKVSQIRKMESDLSLALSSESIRIIAPIPGRDVVGIEASMPYREMVYLKQLLGEKEFLKAEIPLVLGRRADNKVGIKDLARIPHLLVAGTTGSGKSMFIISFISSLLFRHNPDSLKLLLIDPKQVDLSSFKEIPHLLAPIISSASSAVQSLYWAIQEMEKRYRSLAEFQARNHKSFNEKIKKLSQKEKNLHRVKNEEMDQEASYYFEPLPLICVVIEEFGDLMADPSVRRSIENAVVRLAQKARASGIHLVLAMQSPRKDVVTGLIKTNIPGRISFKVASGTDSRVILDDMGAERLLSHGDMLFLEPGSLKATRYHGPFMRDQEVASIVSYWKSQSPEDNFYDSNLMQVLDKKSSSFASFKSSRSSLKQDAMYDEILEFVKSCDVISASLLQRKFQIGYPRAGRIIQDLFDKGQIGPPRGSKPREVLISK